MAVLAYWLDHGKTEKKVAEQVRRGSLPRLPDRVANAPHLDPGQELYWFAYADLSTCRPSPGGMGGDILPIPWTAIAHYATVWGFSSEQLADLVSICRKMDEALAAWHRSKDGNK